MNKPSWDVFRSKNIDAEIVFERDVSLRLFCHDVGIEASKLTCPPNYAGIENVPVEVNGQWLAFQAKHSRDGKQNGDSFSKLRNVIDLIKAGDYRLDKIYCYSSGSSPNTPTAKTAEQKRIESDLKKVDVELEWFYSDQIIALLEDTPNSQLLRASQKFFEQLPQPKLEKIEPSDNPLGFRRLHFGERLSQFSGRESELQRLNEFTDYPDRFSWWFVTGSAMSGKSRLVLEHCLTLSNEWSWGWILNGELSSFDFSNWVPDTNTFIVIDYAMGKEVEIERLFSQIKQAISSECFVYTLRLIIIERENTEWLQSIEHAEAIGNWFINKQYHCCPVNLKEKA